MRRICNLRCRANSGTAPAYILRSLYATPDRAREKDDIALGRNFPAKTQGLLAPTLRKAYVCTEIGIFGRNVPTFPMTDQEVDAFVGPERRKECRRLYKIHSQKKRISASGANRPGNRNPDGMPDNKAQYAKEESADNIR